MVEFQPPLPTSVGKFDQDDRISYSTLDNKYLAVHEDGTEFEFDAASGRWVLAEEEPLDGDDEAQHARPIGEVQGEGDTMSRKRKEPFRGSEVSCASEPALAALFLHLSHRDAFFIIPRRLSLGGDACQSSPAQKLRASSF